MLTGRRVWRTTIRNLWNSWQQSRGRRLRDRRDAGSAHGWNVAAEVMEPRQLLTAGAIDTSFGQNGTVNFVTPFPYPGGSSSHGSVVQSDGKIVTFGSTSADKYGYQQDVLIARYTTSGALDTTFGTSHGYTTVAFGKYSNFIPWAMIEESNGKFLAYGKYDVNLVYSAQVNGVVLQFNSNGTLDKSFGSGGKLIFTPSASAKSMEASVTWAAQDPQGRTLIDVGNPAGLPAGGYIARLNATGIDTTFGTNGFTPNTIGPATIVATPSDPAGYQFITYRGSGTSWMVERFNSNFTVDTSFGTNGIASINVPIDPGQYVAGQTYSVETNSLFIDSSGRIVLTGDSRTNDPNGGEPVHTDPSVARLTASGALDPTFANGGVVTYSMSFGSMHTGAAVMDASGRVVISGSAVLLPNNTTAVVMLRYTADGAIDSTFGTSGAGYSILSTATNRMDLALEPDGKIVLTGDYFISRYLS